MNMIPNIIVKDQHLNLNRVFCQENNKMLQSNNGAEYVIYRFIDECDYTKWTMDIGK